MDLMTYALCKKPNDFVVTLTPTNPADLSGTMDRTPQEILDAVNSGKRIVYNIPDMYALVIPQQFMFILTAGIPTSIIVAGQILYDIDGVNCIVNIITDHELQTYKTGIFPITPVS